MKHPYRDYVAAFAALRAHARALPLGGIASVAVPSASKGPRVLIFAPHPDDECIIGALPLRLLREQSCQVINVAVTQGSNKARQEARYRELADACRFLGFGLIQTQTGGLEKISLEAEIASVAVFGGVVLCHRVLILCVMSLLPGPDTPARALRSRRRTAPADR